MDTSLSKFWETVKDREGWHAAVRGGHKELDTTERLDNNSKVSSVKNITLCVQHSLAPGNLLAWCVSTKGQTGWEKKADRRC